MTVNDIIDLILNYNIARDYKNYVKLYADLPNKDLELVLTKNYFNFQKKSILEHTKISVEETKVQIDECVEFQDIGELNTEINDGYWVGVFYCSVDSWIFNWFERKEEAEKVYQQEKIEYFTVQKILFHTEKGILMEQHH